MNGRILQRGKYLWIAYYHHGKEQRECARHVRTDEKITAPEKGTKEREKEEREAARYLKNRIGELTAEKHGGPAFVAVSAQRITVNDLLDSLELHYRTGKKETPQFTSHLQRIRNHFGLWKAVELKADDIDEYIEEMREQEYTDATINRSTQLLEQAYGLAIQDKKLTAAPRIKHLSEIGNIREGFFETADFEAVVQHLPEYLKDFARFGFWTGRRSGSLKKLRWTDIDATEYVITFQAKNEKNRKPDAVAIPEGPIREIIDRRKAEQPWEDKDGNVHFSEYVFHLDGRPVGDFRKAWKTACKKAGASGRLFHDLRRTAVRNLIFAGVPQAVAMKITGHRTDAVFRRYAIIPPEQAREALAQTQEFVSVSAKRKVTAMRTK